MTVLQAEGSRGLLAYCEEPDGWGVLPSTSRTWTGFRFLREGLGKDINQFESGEIRSDRMVPSASQGNRRVEGEVSFELGPSSHNLLLRHLLTSVWTSGGATAAPYTYSMPGASSIFTTDYRGLSFVKGLSDIPLYYAYTGGRVDSCSFEFPQEGIVTCNARLLFEGENDSTASVLHSSPLTYPAEDPYESNLTEITIVAYDSTKTTGSQYTFTTPLAICTGGRFSISNSLDGSSYVLNSYNRYAIPSGRRRIDGSLNMLFLDDTHYARYVAGTALALRVKFKNGLSGGNERYHQFTFPYIKHMGPSATPKIAGEQGIRIDVPFRAFRHAGYGTDVYLEAKIGEAITLY